MNELVNVICPHSSEVRNVTEYNPDNGLSLLPNEEADVMLQLKEIFDDMYDAIENAEELTDDSPEVRFAKFLWIIRMKEQEITKVKATAEKLILDIETWTDKKINQHQGQIDFLSKQMENYLRQKEIKSLPLCSGTIGLRKQQPKITIVDSDKFYENADESILRRIPESFEPDLKSIKEKLKATGEIPVGVEVIEQDRKFYYKLN